MRCSYSLYFLLPADRCDSWCPRRERLVSARQRFRDGTVSSRLGSDSETGTSRLDSVAFPHTSHTSNACHISHISHTNHIRNDSHAGHVNSISHTSRINNTGHASYTNHVSIINHTSTVSHASHASDASTATGTSRLGSAAIPRRDRVASARQRFRGGNVSSRLGNVSAC